MPDPPPAWYSRYTFEDGLYLLFAADTQNSLVIYLNSLIMGKGIPNPAVSHIRMFSMQLFDVLRKHFMKVFLFRMDAAAPFIIGTSAYAP